jgi:hypothetical protein
MGVVNYLSVDFDVSPRIIWIDTTLSTSISVQNLIDTCSHMSASAANMDDAVLLESSGKEYLTEDGSVKVGLTVTLNNAKIGFQSLGAPDWILCSIEGGNVVAVEDIYTDPRVYIPVIYPTAYISVERVSSSSATLSELSAIQYGSFGGGITIDVIDGVGGTDFPVGTKETPVNNLVDAIEIANGRGFDTLFINKSMVLDSGTNIENFTLVGKSSSTTFIEISSSALCSNINIERCTVSGTLDGGTLINNCNVGNLFYVYGHIHNCGLYGIISLDGNEEAVIEGCFMIDQDDPPTIDMGGSGQDLAMPNYSGIVTIKNLSSATEEIGVGLSSGVVILEDTITAGSIVITGAGRITNNSTGTANVDIDGLMSKDTIAAAVYESIGDEIQYASFGGHVSIDVLTGVSGTTYPIGTIETPVNNLIDAAAIAESRGLNVLFIKGNMTLSNTVNLENYTIKGESIVKSKIVIEPEALVTGTEFIDATISGTLDGMNTTYHCAIQDLSYVQGYIRNCVLEEYTMTLAGGEETVFLNCWSAGARQDKTPTIDMGGSGRALAIRGHSGGMKIVNKTGLDDVVLEFESGRVIIDSTVTAGKIVIRGVGQITDNSTGTAEVDIDGLMSKGTISSAVWDRSMADHLIDGSSGRSLAVSQFNNFVTIDIAGVAGTDFPIGTETTPVNNIADAVAIAEPLGIVRFHFMSDFTFDNLVNIANYDLYGQGRNNTTFTFESGCIVAYCSTYNAKITGLSLGLVYIYNCLIFDYGGSGLAPSDKTVVAENCIVSGTTAVPSNFTGVLKVLSCYTGVNAAGLSSVIVDVDDANFKLIVKGHSGDVKIINSTHVDSYYSLDFESGDIELDSSVTAGTFVIRGVGFLTDNSTGTVKVSDGFLSQKCIANAVWDEPKGDHILSGTTGEILTNLGTELSRALALAQENYYLDQTVYVVYQGAKLLTSGRIRIYSDAISVGTDSNVIAVYNITASYDGDKLQTYKVIKV